MAKKKQKSKQEIDAYEQVIAVVYAFTGICIGFGIVILTVWFFYSRFINPIIVNL